MDIRKKTLLALGITFAALFCIITAASMFLYVDQLERLEQQQVKNEVTEVVSAISIQEDDLSNTLHDWARWDDTYQFVLDLNEDYILQNLNEESLTALPVHLYLVTDNQGQIIYGKEMDPVTGRESPLPDDFDQFLPPGHPFLNHTSPSGTHTGILLLPSGPLLIASSPVLTSRQEGPSPGILVMGRSLDERALARISRITGNPISAHWNSETIADETQLLLLQRMISDSSVVSVSRSENIISGFTVISDVNGQKILIETDQPRDLYQNGLGIIRTYLLIFAIIILFTLAVVLLVVDHTILKRLDLLTNRVRKIGLGHNDNMKPVLAGSDEIALLEQEILSTHANLKNSEQTLNTFINAVSDPSSLLKPDGTIILANTAIAQVLGQSPANLQGKNIRTFFPVQVNEEEMKLLQEVISDKKMVQLERFLWGKNYLISLYPVIGLEGNVDQIAFMSVDITDFKRVEIALQRATKNINLLNMIIFNDIQNQVFIQLGYSTLLERETSDPKILDLIKKEETAAQVIQTSLDFAKEYQAMGIKPPLWQNINQILIFAISHLDLTSITHIFQVEGLEIFADPLLEKVLSRIIQNTTIHGKGATSIRVGFCETGEGLIIFFEDNGPGIAYDRKEKIFAKGMGAGSETSLFLIREILSITGITIKENGEPGKGARFEMLVPKEAYRHTLKNK